MSISLNSITLSPTPFVSTSYEYSKSGESIIGGFLIVTLSGKVISENVLSDLNTISSLQSGNNCLSLNIGCGSANEFLNGANGKIRSVDISVEDEPFLGSYTIQIAIETLNGEPIVSPDSQFLKGTCLTTADYIQSYTETINVNADATSIGLVDNDTGLSKSFVKANGQITLVSLSTQICGKADYKSIDNLVSILSQRAESLLSLSACGGSVLSSYNGWNKWIDTQTLDINSGAGSVTWSFDLYMSTGSSAPYAWADITTEDKYDIKKRMENRTISGSIKGLSLSSGSFLGNKLTSSDRLANATRAYNVIVGMVTNGSWPSDIITDISGYSGTCTTTNDPCLSSIEPVCYQRISSNINKSIVTGEISFSSEFGSISACAPNQESQIDVTVEETVSAIRHNEIFIPNGIKSSVVVIGDTPSKVVITGKGTLKGCDRSKMPNLQKCVNAEMQKNMRLYNGWKQLRATESFGTYSYGKTLELIKCF